MVGISVMELVLCLSDVMDLISINVQDHHKKVAIATYHLAAELDICGPERQDIVIAAAMHDVGWLSLNDRLSALLDFEDSSLHAETGYKLLAHFDPFETIAKIIRYHHTPWNYGKAVDANGNSIHIGSQIILMADRITVMIKPGIHVLDQTSDIINEIVAQENKIYKSELVSAIKRLSTKDAFWLDIMSYSCNDFLRDKLRADDNVLSESHLVDIMDLFSKIIDFRSKFTATHSQGVATVAEALARLVGFSDQECRMMKIAGLLHDFGKLAIPTEILEKTGPLKACERNVIRTHAYYTDRLLSNLSGFEIITKWASSHHENLDGSGYPFSQRREELSLGSRIMKVADVFVALMEDRPYRDGMDIDTSLDVLSAMVDDNKLDGYVVSKLSSNAQLVNALRLEGAAQAAKQYAEFRAGFVG